MISRTCRRAVRRSNFGFSLIEVMVAVAILSIGLLGLAALHATSLRANQGANLRSQATNAAYSIIDNIRANRRHASAYGTALGAAAPSCTPGTTAIAICDIANWRRNLAATLPEGDGAVTLAAGVITVDVRWLDERAGGNAAGGTQTTFRVTTRI